MLKSFHLGHVCEARAEAFSRTRRRSETKVVQRAKKRAKEYSATYRKPTKYSNEMKQSEDESSREPKSEPSIVKSLGCTVQTIYKGLRRSNGNENATTPQE